MFHWHLPLCTPGNRSVVLPFTHADNKHFLPLKDRKAQTHKMWNFRCYLSAAKILSHRRFRWKPQHLVSTAMGSVFTGCCVSGQKFLSLFHELLSVLPVVGTQCRLCWLLLLDRVWFFVETTQNSALCCFTPVFCVQLQKPIKSSLWGRPLKRGFGMAARVQTTSCVQPKFHV